METDYIMRNNTEAPSELKTPDPSDLPSGIVVLRFAVLGTNLDVAVLGEVNDQDEQDPEFLQSSLYKTEIMRASLPWLQCKAR